MASTNQKWNRREKIHHASKTPLLPQNFSGSGSWESNSIQIYLPIHDKPHVISSDISTSPYVKPPLPCSTGNLIQVFLPDVSFWMKAPAVFDHKSSQKKSQLSQRIGKLLRNSSSSSWDHLQSRSQSIQWGFGTFLTIGFFGGNLWWGVFCGNLKKNGPFVLLGTDENNI